jgi:ribosomal protein S18 acetylase RimI-like enzyme
LTRVPVSTALAPLTWECDRIPWRPVVAPACAVVRTAALGAVGHTVDDLYPEGLKKLARRFDDARAGRACGHVLLASGCVAGYAMESPKGSGVIKLSTFWISPTTRRRGFGRGIASTLVLGWLDRCVERAYLTARVGLDRALLSTLAPLGFEKIAVVPDRYGEGCDEAILEWRPERAPDELWLAFHASRIRTPDNVI